MAKAVREKADLQAKAELSEQHRSFIHSPKTKSMERHHSCPETIT